jgi:hypothetical protein
MPLLTAICNITISYSDKQFSRLNVKLLSIKLIANNVKLESSCFSFMFKELIFSHHVTLGQINSQTQITNKKTHQFHYHVNQAITFHFLNTKFFRLASGKPITTSCSDFGQKTD